MGISALRWKGECRIWGSTKEKPTIWFSQSCNPAVLISHPWLGPSWKNNGLYSQKPLPLCCLVTKSCPTLWHHELQHARLLCPSLSHGVCSNSCPLSQWCYPTISSSISPFSCPQSFPASGSFHYELALLSRWPKYGSFSSRGIIMLVLWMCLVVKVKSNAIKNSIT